MGSKHRPRAGPPWAGRRSGTDEPDSGDTIMSDIVSDLATKSGLSPEQAQKGLGAVLAFVQQKLPKEDFAKVSEAVPNSDQILAAVGEQEKASGGIIES